MATYRGRSIGTLGAFLPMWRALVAFALISQLGTAAPRPHVTARSVNISDNEVREIQTVVESFKRRAITYIGTVTVGCVCEDGPSCTDEVHVILYHPVGTLLLKLSKIDGRWMIGPNQAWEIEWERLAHEAA